ncbi:MAG: phage major capsid protein [Enterococcus sp.]|nr:phage major capsid protein [Enterococcus sp.]
MKLEKREIKKEWQPEKIDLLQLFNARCDEAARLTAELRKESIDEDTADAVRASLNSITEEAEKIASLLDNWDKPAAEPDGGERAFNPLATMEMRTLGGMDFSSGNKPFSTEKRGNYTMRNNTYNAEIEKEKREFYAQFTEKRAAGDTTSMAAVIPTTVIGQYVIEKAPGAFYEGASKTNIAHSGTLKLPIAALQTISAHTENASITPAGYVPSTLSISHSELAYNTGYSDLGVALGVESFMGIIDNTLIGSMLKKFDGLCVDAVAALTYVKDTNAVEYANGSAPDYSDFVTLAGMLGADYVGGAKWYMAPATYFKLVAGLVDDGGQPILDASKKIEDNALLGYGFELDAQIPAGVIYFGEAARVHFNAARPAELNRWTNFDTNTEMAGIRAVAGAACEAGAFVKMYEASAT